MSSLLTFGETMLRLSPTPGNRLETARQLDFRTAGAESNVAIAASNLGLEATWASKLPDSPLGRRVTREVRSHGVETNVAWTDEGRQGAYFIEQGGEPRGTNVIYDRADAAVRTATPDELTDGIDLETVDALYTSGITPALSDRLEATTATLLERAQEAGATTVFDLNYRSKLWSPAEARACCEELLESVDIPVVAARDARSVLDLSGSDEEIAREIATTYDADVVVVTQGAEGALALEGDGTVHDQPAFPAETTDPIGTGDAFVGGFLASYLAGEDRDVAGALEYGSATAALKRTINGDLAVLTPAEVEGVIDDADGGIDR
ncbi:bifunctional 2-dehydro-3-deoxygluconokinase/2-dehydro-3-deoxygalactonokinase [Halopiger xanaduensis]|uniref:PfkB domain protein n=1 Tax=Halopiger xanaduensis (strain DSM 18323 / JCM 14033 / SH-6) TaxID=797210 RepID=F8DAX5_HALXS|nr:bifunctional 2-dehydro-3-deoxygluconokinase/2-dehydro-3-deoxygalactonokinase [Halopiger xanaduensis]AEH38216.1 PfkB domain protein [Halopiger xanaduensis SH-6]